MDVAVGKADKARWLIPIYDLPREPSRHQVAVWRKPNSLGALYLQDGVAALPEGALTRHTDAIFDGLYAYLEVL